MFLLWALNIDLGLHWLWLTVSLCVFKNLLQCIYRGITTVAAEAGLQPKTTTPGKAAQSIHARTIIEYYNQKHTRTLSVYRKRVTLLSFLLDSFCKLIAFFFFLLCVDVDVFCSVDLDFSDVLATFNMWVLVWQVWVPSPRGPTGASHCLLIQLIYITTE